MAIPISTFSDRSHLIDTIFSDSFCLKKEALKKLFECKLELRFEQKLIGKISLGDFLKAVHERFQTYYGEGFLQDVDISIELPLQYHFELTKISGIVQEVIKELKIALPKKDLKAPFFRRALISEDDFQGVILSLGEEGGFWVDLTVVTANK